MQAFSKKYPFTDMESKDHQGIAPVIIIGMHRSGTSMLARALSELGVFMGRRRTRNEECLWTNKINYWIFAQASATWERPEGMDTLLRDPDLCHTISDYMQGIVSGPACARYMGLRRYARYGSLFRVAEPWGWKDPRNTFTLPLWLTLFPNAKVVHIIRHGVDVAQSLRNRRNRDAGAAAQRYWGRRGLYANNPLAPKRSGFAHSPRVADLEGGMALWEAYTSRGRELVRKWENQSLELYYEEMVRNPVQSLKQITEFCGVKASHENVLRVSEGFDPEKAYAYRQSELLTNFSSKFLENLQKFAYR